MLKILYKCIGIGVLLKIFSLFVEFFFQIVCRFQNLLYLCTRFREATQFAERYATMILDNIPYRQSSTTCLSFIL